MELKLESFVENKEKLSTIIINPFGDKVNIAISHNIRKLIKSELKEQGASDELINDVLPDKNTDGVSISIDEEGIRMFFVAIALDADLSVLIHESLHIISNVLCMKGIYFSKQTEEIYAYFQQWFFDEFINEMS